MLDAGALIEKHRARGVLVDTNLLVLLLVGTVNKQRTPNFKRTEDFTIEDYELLVRLTNWFGKLIATPHVLSQVSDLTNLSGKELTSIRELFKLLVVQDVEETYDESRVIVGDPASHALGWPMPLLRQSAREEFSSSRPTFNSSLRYTGTDYCDLTGEVQWIRRMLQRYETAARKSGARIVNCCGFDSIPSDMGVHFLQRQAMKQFGAPCTRVKMRVKVMRGEFSGGTVASLMNVVKEAAADPALRKELADPYSLCPVGTPRVRQPNLRSAQFDADFGSWVAPFVMSAINTRIVQRTNALSDQAYGGDFTYEEAVLTGRGLKGRLAAAAMAAGLSGFMLAAAIRPARAALERFVLPKPGEGPSPEAQRTGFFDLRFLGMAADGRQMRTKVTGDRDPGYGSTGKMLGQAAACLALDVDKTASPGGFWTPATIFGDRLIQRLTARSGLTFDLVPD